MFYNLQYQILTPLPVKTFRQIKLKLKAKSCFLEFLKSYCEIFSIKNIRF